MRLAALPALLVLAACGADGITSPTPFRMAGECMGTSWSAVVTLQPGDEYDEVVAVIQTQLDAIDAALSTWKDDSDLSRLNRADAGERVEVSEATLGVLRMAVGLRMNTGGAFDPTVGPLVQLWGFGRYDEAVDPPTDEEVDAARARLGVDAIEFGPFWISRTRDDVEIDASAIAKGFGVDAAAAALEERGYESFLLEVGGEMVLRGVNPDGVVWRVGVDDPLPPEGSDPLSPLNLAQRPPIARIGVRDAAVATSGDYRNVRRVGDRIVSHSIDPRTGRPIDHALASVTVLAEHCVLADALATAALVLGPVDGLDLLERFKDVEGYLLIRTDDPNEPLEARLTSGMGAYMLDGPGAPNAPAPEGR